MRLKVEESFTEDDQQNGREGGEIDIPSNPSHVRQGALVCEWVVQDSIINPWMLNGTSIDPVNSAYLVLICCHSGYIMESRLHFEGHGSSFRGPVLVKLILVSSELLGHSRLIERNPTENEALLAHPSSMAKFTPSE